MSLLGKRDSICQGPEVQGTWHFEKLIEGWCGWRVGLSGKEAVTQALSHVGLLGDCMDFDLCHKTTGQQLQ
jgi:hypothetical protein